MNHNFFLLDSELKIWVLVIVFTAYVACSFNLTDVTQMKLDFVIFLFWLAENLTTVHLPRKKSHDLVVVLVKKLTSKRLSSLVEQVHPAQQLQANPP